MSARNSRPFQIEAGGIDGEEKYVWATQSVDPDKFILEVRRVDKYSSDGFCYIGVAEATEIARRLTEWVATQPKPFPFKTGDILQGQNSGYLYVVTDDEVHTLAPTPHFSYTRAPDERNWASEFTKIGKID